MIKSSIAKSQFCVIPHAKHAIAALVALASISASFAQGSDNASNYSGNWTNGSNQGTGFGAWNLFGTGTHGHFLGNSTAQGFGDVNTSGLAFAMYGNPDGNNYANAQRSFSSPLDQGQSFSIKLAIAYRNGNKGIDLYSAGGFGDNNKLWNFNVGGDTYTANGANLTTSGENWAYSQTSVFTLTANQVTSNTINISLTRGTDTYSATVNGTLGGVGLYVGSSTDGDNLNNLYFNDLQILGNPTIVPSITGSPYAVAAVGSSFNYQVSASPAATSYNATGLPAGLTINSTTGLISGTPSTTGSSSVSITATNDTGSSAPFVLTIAVGTAADTAGNYGDNWTTGSNAGTGFGNWTITSNSGTAGFAGAFLGNAANAEITGMGARSFGLFANPPDSNAFATAERDLSTPLSQGQSLSFQWAINWDSGSGNSTNGNKGFSLSTATGETIVVNNANSSNITIESKSNNSTDVTNLQYGTAAMLWTFTQTTNSSLTITATPRGPGADYTTSLPTSGAITSVKFYASNMQNGDNAQPYFNNFLITGGSTPEPPAYDSWASSYGLNATVTTGPTAGAPTADPDSDSFTNQQEYAFGTNPTEATAGLLTTSNGLDGLTIVFLTRSGLTYNVQTTDNLSTTAFSNNGSVSVIDGPTSPTPPSGYTRKQFTIVPSGSKNFFRVLASE